MRSALDVSRDVSVQSATPGLSWTALSHRWCDFWGVTLEAAHAWTGPPSARMQCLPCHIDRRVRRQPGHLQDQLSHCISPGLGGFRFKDALKGLPTDNTVALGKGLPLFAGLSAPKFLNRFSSTTFPRGTVAQI